MVTSNQTSTGSSAVPKWLVPSFLALSLIGFADAAYLTAEHFLGRIPPCTVINGCEQVLTSQFAVVFGLPVALFGALYYASVFFGTMIYRETGKDGLLKGIAWLTVIGFLATLWFLYLQLFVIHAICMFCLLSASTSTGLFGLGQAVFYKK